MTSKIQNIFAEAASSYELINHVLTLGLDIHWRNRAARLAVRAGGRRWLDACTGTGEMARTLERLSPRGTMVTAVDFSLPMLHHALKKARRGAIKFVRSTLPFLPFADGAFDLVTISFATRNINLHLPALLACFRELHRILRPGGYFLNLETSQPPNLFFRTLFHVYIHTVVRPVGRRISGSGAAYAYLASTIPRFYDAPALRDILLQAGFRPVSFRRFLFGAAASHLALKPRAP